MHTRNKSRIGVMFIIIINLQVVVGKSSRK